MLSDLVQSGYFFNGSSRWSIVFKNPNHTAALVAQILPILVVVIYSAAQSPDRRRREMVIFGLMSQAFLWFILAKTFSRGGIIAAVVGVLSTLFVCRSAQLCRNLKRFWVLASIILGSAAMIIVAMGVLPRFHSIAGGDASAWNRIDYWKAGLRLFHASPLNGWGSGQAGLALMH